MLRDKARLKGQVSATVLRDGKPKRRETWNLQVFAVMLACLVRGKFAEMKKVFRYEYAINHNIVTDEGDALVAAISAASIVAKVSRDREMLELDARYPGYGLAQHKGYPSQAHLAALQALGASPVHRRSYAPVRRALDARGEAD